MQKIKTKLIEIASQNKNENNAHYWNDVICDIEDCNDILDLLAIVRIDFGFETFDEVMGKQKPNKNAITNQRDLLIAFMRYLNEKANLKYTSVGIERKVDNFLKLNN